MKLKDHRLSSSLCVLILATLLTGQSTLGDFVLCLGADGHVALEPAVGPGGTCETPADSQPQLPTTPGWRPEAGILEGHCGSCDDLALLHPTSTFSEPSRLLLNVSHLGMSLSPSFHSLTENARPIRLNQLHRRAPLASSLAVLRTTILLI